MSALIARLAVKASVEGRVKDAVFPFKRGILSNCSEKIRLSGAERYICFVWMRKDATRCCMI